MRILAIDPGPVKSAWVIWDGRSILDKEISPNTQLLKICRERPKKADCLVIEQVRSYGMTVGATVFDTVFWSGRFCEAWGGTSWFQVPRMEIKMHLCKNSRAKDANIRQAIIDRWGGKESAIGKTKCRGPFYGVKADEWSALALAITWYDQNVIFFMFSYRKGVSNGKKSTQE